MMIGDAVAVTPPAEVAERGLAPAATAWKGVNIQSLAPDLV